MGRPGDRYEIFLLRGEFRPFFGFILIWIMSQFK
jgi:hypothetical protein